jgi:hypothetical protein
MQQELSIIFHEQLIEAVIEELFEWRLYKRKEKLKFDIDYDSSTRRIDIVLEFSNKSGDGPRQTGTFEIPINSCMCETKTKVKTECDKYYDLWQTRKENHEDSSS